MKKIITIIAILLLTAAGAMAKSGNEDSSYAALINRGSNLLKKQVAQNESISTGKTSGTLNYIIDVEGGLLNQTDPPITTETQINGFKGFFNPDNAANAAALANFNAKLTALNNSNAVKVYYLLINGFNVEYRAKLEEGMTVSSFFNDTLISKNTDMLSYQKTHDELATAIYNNAFNVPGNQNNNVMVVAVGHYHLVNFAKISYYSKIRELNYAKVFPSYFMGLDDPRQHMEDLFIEKLKELTQAQGWNLEYSNTAEIMDVQLTALESAYKKYLGKKALLTTYTVAGIKTIVGNYTDGDFASLRKQERIHILSVLVGQNMFGNWGYNGITNEEEVALNVLKTVPASEAEAMLTMLKATSTVAANPAYLAANANNPEWVQSWNQQRAGYAMIRRLISGIDDGPFGTHYAELIAAVKRLCTKSPEFGGRYIDAAANFETRTFSVGKPDAPYPGERVFDDATIANDGKVTVKSKVFFPPKNVNKNPKSPFDYLNLPESVNKYLSTTFEETALYADAFAEELGDYINGSAGGLSLMGNPEIPKGTHNYQAAPDVVLDPFDLVMATINTDVSSVKDGAGNSMDNAQKRYFVPAVFLYYAKDKLRNHAIGTGVRVAADLLVIAATFGTGTPAVVSLEAGVEVAEAASLATRTVSGVAKVRRFFALFNGLCAAGDLGIVITGIENDPKYKEFVKWFQYVQMLGAGGELGYGFVRRVVVNGERFIAKAENLTPKIKEYCKKFVLSWDDFKAKVYSTPSLISGDGQIWKQVIQRSEAFKAQFCLWFPELLQQVDVSIENIYSAAKAMRAKVLAQGPALYSAPLITPKFAAKTVYVFAYCLKVGKDATKRSLAALLQHIKKVRGEINATEPIPDELVDDVGRLTQNEFDGVVALQDEARLLSADDMLAAVNNCGSIERAGKFANVLGEKMMAVMARCKQLGLDKAQMETLIADFTANADFLAAVKSDDNVLKAWKVMLNGKRAMQTRTDLIALAKTTEVMQDAKVIAALNASGVELVEIIAAYKGFFKVKGYAERLEDLKLFCNKFHDRNIPGFNDMIKTMKNQNAMVQDGMQHALTQLNKAEFDAAKVKKFDMDFELAEGFDCPYTQCKFDVEMIDGNSVRFYEFKSYQDASKISLNQFKAYISRINRIDELRYIFNENKITNVNLAIDGIQSFLKRGTNTNDIFSIVWSNQPLRLNLFPNITEQVPALDAFKALVDNKNSVLYKFIEIKK